MLRNVSLRYTYITELRRILVIHRSF